MGTGIDRAQIQATNLGKGIKGVAQEQLQLSMIMDAMTKRFAEVGTPMTTVKELFTQIHMVQGAFIEDLAFSLTHSNAFAQGIESISKWLMKVTPQVLDFAKGLGEKLGEAYYGVSTAVEAAMVPLVDFNKALIAVTTSILKMVGVKPTDFAFTWKESMAALALEFISIGYWIERAGTKLKTYGQIAYNVAGGDVKAAIAAYDEGQAKLKELDANLAKDVLDNAKFLTQPTQKESEEGGKHTEVTQIDPNVLNERRRLTLQIATEQAKIRLETALQELHDEEDAEKQKYELGLQTLAEFLAKEKTLKQAELQDRLAEIRQERDAKLAALKLEQPGVKDPISGKIVGGMDPEVRRKKEQLINLQADDAAAKARAAAQKEDLARNQQLLQDQIAARREYVAAINKIEQDGVKERIRLLDEEFKQGVGTADQ